MEGKNGSEISETFACIQIFIRKIKSTTNLLNKWCMRRDSKVKIKPPEKKQKGVERSTEMPQFN